MIDIRLLRDNLELMKKNILNRNMQADAELVLKLYEEKNHKQTLLENLRKQRNDTAEKVKSCPQEEKTALIELGKQLKEQIAEKEHELNLLNAQFEEEAVKLPNYAHPDAPLGLEDKDNRELRVWGSPKKFGFKPKDHVRLAEELDLVDFEAGARVSGPKFYFLKNQAVLLEAALVRYALDVLMKHGFTLYQTPDIAREEILMGIGFQPRGEESNIYPLEGTGTCLVGTAEITLGGYHADQIINVDKPILMGGVSHCFRREAGSAGQFSKGLYRVHQFTKVEMFIFCRPEESSGCHEKLCRIEEEIFSNLEIPYRVVDICVGTLGAPAYRKYDLEAWMPGRGENGDWGEITSTSNCTDFQARRLNIRFKDSDGKNKIVHTLNGTAIAVSRALVALMENFQQEDGSILMPKVLHPYLGFDCIKPKNSL